MPDDQTTPASDSASAEPSAPTSAAGTNQTPVFDGLPPAPTEPISEPTPGASASAPNEPAEPVSEAVEPAAEPRSEPVASEQKPTPATSGAAAAASAPIASPTNTPEHDRELLKIARAKIQTRKQQDLEKMMKLFDTKEKITNDNVEKALKCSDSSAFRYLRELVKQGKIKRVGKTGAGVEYIKA